MKTPTKRVHRTITISEWAEAQGERLAESRGLKLSAMLELLIREQVKREPQEQLGEKSRETP